MSDEMKGPTFPTVIELLILATIGFLLYVFVQLTIANWRAIRWSPVNDEVKGKSRRRVHLRAEVRRELDSHLDECVARLKDARETVNGVIGAAEVQAVLDAFKNLRSWLRDQAGK